MAQFKTMDVTGQWNYTSRNKSYTCGRFKITMIDKLITEVNISKDMSQMFHIMSASM